MKKSELLRAELEVAELEDALVEAKESRKVCGECGCVQPASKAQEAKISEAKAELREKRKALREARVG